jgi:hypothetical protein
MRQALTFSTQQVIPHDSTNFGEKAARNEPDEGDEERLKAEG